MTKRVAHDEVTIDIDASPQTVYGLISDITRMGEWSPECVRCSWAKGATGPAIGARFKAKNKGGRGPAWYNTPKVTAAEPGRDPLGSRDRCGTHVVPRFSDMRGGKSTLQNGAGRLARGAKPPRTTLRWTPPA